MNLRSLPAVAALLVATAVPLADAAAPKITSKGVGRVKLGRTFDRLHSAHLIGHLRIPRRGGGKLQFGVSTQTRKTTMIGIPSLAFCE
jgi:hypothetical protein